MSGSRLRSPLLVAAVAASAAFACGGDRSTGPGSSTPAKPPAPIAARITLTPAGPDTIVPRATRQLTATVYSTDGLVLPGQPVTYRTSNSSVATVDSVGLVTAVGAYGTVTVVASVTTSTGAVIFGYATVVVFDRSLVGIPQTITLAQPISTTLSVGASTPVRVMVTDVYGHPVAGTSVTFQVANGNGAVSPSTAVTDANGTATTTWTVGTVLVLGNSITASVANAQTTISCAPLPGPATAIATSVPFAGVTVGSDVRISVTAQDTYTNQVSPPSLQFTSRNPAILTSPTYPVPGDVIMTSQAVGQTYLVASAGALADSTLVAVFPIDGVLVSAPPPRFDLGTGTTFSTNVQLSTGPSTPPIGSLTATVRWDPTVLTYVSDAPSSQLNGLVTVNRDSVANGLLTFAVATGTSIGAPVALRVLTFTAASTPNRRGTLSVSVSDISTNNFVTLLPVTQVVSFPVRTR